MKMFNLFRKCPFLLLLFCIFAAMVPLIKNVITGGPLRDLKFGGLTYRPTKDSGSEVKLSAFEFENMLSPNGDIYSTGNSEIGYVQQECAMTAAEYKAHIAMQDGNPRSGVATMPNGDVLSINAAIEGEQILSDGKITVKFAGFVKLQ